MPGIAEFDVAIVGAGVSGLVLGWLLAEGALADLTVLLVDGARDDYELRTLSFWSAGPVPPFESLVRHRWSTLRMHAGADLAAAPRDAGPRGGAPSRAVRLREYTYRTLFFADLQREAKARLAARPGHRVVEGRLDRLDQDAAGATLHLGEQAFRSRWVLDSRFHLRDLHVDGRRYHDLRQHFHGWVVRTSAAVFAPEVATLLDFRIGADAGVPDGTAFFYVLPFSPREALVELVTLEPVDAEPLTRAYLARAFGADDLEFVDRESGPDAPVIMHECRDHAGVP